MSSLPVTIMPIAAANMITEAAYPTVFANGPLILSPIIFPLFETNMMITSNGGDKTPLMTPVQKRAVIGLIPIKSITTDISGSVIIAVQRVANASEAPAME